MEPAAMSSQLGVRYCSIADRSVSFFGERFWFVDLCFSGLDAVHLAHVAGWCFRCHQHSVRLSTYLLQDAL